MYKLNKDIMAKEIYSLKEGASTPSNFKISEI